MENLNTEIAIVGGGPAGISAAIVAAEKGADVTLFEKSDHTGGASNGGMGMFAVESRLQHQNTTNFQKRMPLTSLWTLQDIAWMRGLLRPI